MHTPSQPPWTHSASSPGAINPAHRRRAEAEIQRALELAAQERKRFALTALCAALSGLIVCLANVAMGKFSLAAIGTGTAVVCCGIELLLWSRSLKRSYLLKTGYHEFLKQNPPYLLGDCDGTPYLECNLCGARSFDPRDIAQHYCGHCHRHFPERG